MGRNSSVNLTLLCIGVFFSSLGENEGLFLHCFPVFHGVIKLTEQK